MTSPTIGHDAQAAAILDAMRGDRLHHAWLLTGPRGVGKAGFARAVALRLLAEAADASLGGEGLAVPSSHPIAHLFAADSHPDYRLLQREPWDSKGNIIPIDDRTGKEDPARNIRIKQVRALDRLFSVTPSQSSRRVVVIDSINDLEPSAANALLKNLEEPPAETVFFLVSHAAGRLLPTIRSRCRILRFGAHDETAMRAILTGALPEARPHELTALIGAGEGIPGSALRLAGLDITAIDTALVEIARTGDPTNAQRSALARSLALKAAQPRYDAYLERAPAFIASAARTRSGPALADAIGLWEKAQALASSAQGLSLDPQSVVFEIGSLVAGLAGKASVAKA